MVLIWLIAGHLLGDFAFQSDWLAVQKGKSWEVNAYHALVYTAAMFVVAAIGDIALPVLVLFIIFLSHFIIDPLKSRWYIIKHIWLDQLLHLAVLVVILPLI